MAGWPGRLGEIKTVVNLSEQSETVHPVEVVFHLTVDLALTNIICKMKIDT